MKAGARWSWVVSAAGLLVWFGVPRCAGQTRPPAPLMPSAAEINALPSTVSPTIARFLSQSGRDLSAAAPPIARPVSMPTRAQVPSPAPPRPVVNPRQAGAGLAERAPVAGSSPLALNLRLKPAPLAPDDFRFPINLATALRLSDARPLMVAAAQAGVWVAEGELLQAKVLWLPALNIATDYLRHDGGGPDFNKGIMTAPSTNFFYAGAGLWGFISLTDALYEPLVARRVLNSRHWDVQKAKNDALFQTAESYFAVHQSRGMYAGSLYTVERGRDLVDRVTSLSKDLVPEVEVERARNMLADLEQKAVSARQQWRVSSANLTQVLRLDPRAVVEPLEHDHVQITLVDPGLSLEELMPIALANRPELASREALVQAAEVAVQREKARPFIPLFILSGYQTPGGMLIQGGIYGFGPNSSMNQWRGRADVSTQLIWQVENFGIGNLAKIKKQRGRESKAIIELRKAQDLIAADVTRARARVQSAAARVSQADRALRTAIITYNGTFEGLKETSRFGDVLVLINRPQEVVYALQLLNVAFDQYFATVAEYNVAQFELYHALGYPAQEISSIRPTGSVMPVDTARPGFLPPVGNGPPRATR